MVMQYFYGVLATPRPTLQKAARSGGGFEVLAFLVGLEWLLVEHLSVASAAMRLPTSPWAGLIGVWSQLVHFALEPAVFTALFGVGLYYASRRFSDRSLSFEGGVALAACLRVPHTLMVALGVTLAGAGWDHPVWPQHAHAGAAVTGADILRWCLSWGPSLALLPAAWAAVREDSETTAPKNLSSARRALAALGTLVVVAGLSLGGLRVAQEWQRVRPLLAGDPLPALGLNGLNQARLGPTDLRGQVVLLDFWATWCGPCVAAMPKLEALHQDFGSRGFTLVSINVEPDNVDAVARFVAEHELSFPVFFDHGAHLRRRFQIQNYPTLFLVDRSGTVRKVYLGITGIGGVRRDIESMLKSARADLSAL